LIELMQMTTKERAGTLPQRELKNKRLGSADQSVQTAELPICAMPKERKRGMEESVEAWRRRETEGGLPVVLWSKRRRPLMVSSGCASGMTLKWSMRSMLKYAENHFKNGRSCACCLS
jgi:hypothetical protein